MKQIAVQKILKRLPRNTLHQRRKHMRAVRAVQVNAAGRVREILMQIRLHPIRFAEQRAVCILPDAARHREQIAHADFPRGMTAILRHTIRQKVADQIIECQKPLSPRDADCERCEGFRHRIAEPQCIHAVRRRGILRGDTLRRDTEKMGQMHIRRSAACSEKR